MKKSLPRTRKAHFMQNKVKPQFLVLHITMQVHLIHVMKIIDLPSTKVFSFKYVKKIFQGSYKLATSFNSNLIKN